MHDWGPLGSDNFQGAGRAPVPVKAVCLYDTRQRSVETRKRATSKHIVKLFFHRRVATPF